MQTSATTAERNNPKRRLANMRDHGTAKVSRTSTFLESIFGYVSVTSPSVSVPSEKNRSFVNFDGRGRKGRGLFNSCRLDLDTGCWNWTGSTQSNGYGQTTFGGKRFLVHRVSAIIWLHFDESSRLDILHRCDNRICFNPKHLFIGTDLENIRDMMAKGRDNFRGDKGPKKTIIMNRPEAPTNA